jgi:MFS family permease
MGLNESAGYLAVAFTAVLTGYIAAHAGLRPEPFLVGVAYAAVGLGLSTLAVRETRQHARQEGSTHTQSSDLSDADVFVLTSLREPALSSASQAGLVNNLNDGLAWGLFPVLFTSVGLSLGQVAVLVAIYPAIWGVGQLITGALSDRWGRKHLITGGMLLQAAALAGIATAHSFTWWAVAAAFLGAGTAMVYPTLLAAVSDVSHPSWRARAVGVYRLWRDLGFAVGALLTGLLADAWGIRPAVWAVAGLTALSGVVVAWRMYETHHA